MAYREVTVIQAKEALRRWLQGEGERPIARGAGLSRGTVRRYVSAAQVLGVERDGGEEQLTDALIGQVCELVRPSRPDGHGEAWRALLAEEEAIRDWVKGGLTVVKIGILLGRKGVDVPHRTLARFCVERCGAGRRSRTTVRVDDPPPGIELQVDFGRLGLAPTGDGANRVCWALIFTACFSRHMFVWPGFAQTTEAVIEGFEAAWRYFGGVFAVVIPDSMKAIVETADNTAPRFTQRRPGPAPYQSGSRTSRSASSSPRTVRRASWRRWPTSWSRRRIELRGPPGVPAVPRPRSCADRPCLAAVRSRQPGARLSDNSPRRGKWSAP